MNKVVKASLWIMPVMVFVCCMSSTYSMVVITGTIEDLARSAGVVVLVDVREVSTLTSGERIARAHVKEVWKGEVGGEVTYNVTRTFACDTSDAVVGETVLLFLNSMPAPRPMRIAWEGRGRFPVTSETPECLVRVGCLCAPQLPTVTLSDGPGQEVKAVALPVLRDFVRNAIGRNDARPTEDHAE